MVAKKTLFAHRTACSTCIICTRKSLNKETTISQICKVQGRTINAERSKTSFVGDGAGSFDGVSRLHCDHPFRRLSNCLVQRPDVINVYDDEGQTGQLSPRLPRFNQPLPHLTPFTPHFNYPLLHSSLLPGTTPLPMPFDPR